MFSRAKFRNQFFIVIANRLAIQGGGTRKPILQSWSVLPKRIRFGAGAKRPGPNARGYRASSVSLEFSGVWGDSSDSVQSIISQQIPLPKYMPASK